MLVQCARMYARRRWKIADADERATELARTLGTSEVTAQILINRGLTETDPARAFLRPQLKDLLEPSLIPGLTKAAIVIARAIRDGKKITIYGDYDVDGITATSILWHAFKLLGADVRYYIPHRVDEGYGLNAEAVKQLCDEGTQLLITVDCGITAIEPVRVARERGVDVVVTDHHEWKVGSGQWAVGSADASDLPTAHCSPPTPLLPDATAIVHPRLPGEDSSPSAYPNPHLCGAGVAFKLAWGVGQQLGSGGKVAPAMKDFLVEATALAALGTIADVVPLVGENRILARFGLGCVKASKLNGIRALITSANLDGQNIDSYHVGFLLGPRLNACGRMGHARLAVEMLTDASTLRAAEIASYLESQNRERQATERGILDQAVAQAIELGLNTDKHHAVVLGGQGWHAGVIGIVASRIVERFHKPTIMVSLGEDGVGHGSGRSIVGFHLSKALDACTHHLQKHGGHEMAAGLTVDNAKFEDFRSAFLDHAKSALTPEQLVPVLRIDTIAGLEQVTHALVDEMGRLGPFGNGNPKPLIACKGVTLTAAPKVVGKKGEHLQLHVRQGNRFMKAIAFNAASLLDQLKPGKPIDLAVEPQINEWNGQKNVELEVKDISLPE
ncbi:MAG: DHHA1 domain-containing protein [Tepidisphaeraceae bacterium]